MSKYKIYQVNHYDPELVGKKRRQMGIIFGIASFILLVIYLIVNQLTDNLYFILYPVILILIIGSYIFFFRLIKIKNKQFRTIGNIEFAKTGIRKEIGDSVSEYNYDSIRSIELIKHIPAVKMSESKSGFFTYILSLDFRDDHNERFVVSDQPAGERRNICIIDTIKTLEKIISTKIIIT